MSTEGIQQVYRYVHDENGHLSVLSCVIEMEIAYHIFTSSRVNNLGGTTSKGKRPKLAWQCNLVLR